MARPERLELPTLWFEARCSDPTELRARANHYNHENSELHTPTLRGGL
jgi:hypothetical protein